jgi:hypothetical protein
MHTLTWDNYTGVESPEDARYILDGIVVGHGWAGFGNVLDKMRGLQEGEKLLIYPDYLILMQRPGYSGPSLLYPWHDKMPQFWEVVQRKRLDIYYAGWVWRQDRKQGR